MAVQRSNNNIYRQVMTKTGECDEFFIGIDYLKGCLIILVILGHLIKGEQTDNLARYIIYSFHIPLFVAVSGFLYAPTLTQINSNIIFSVRKYVNRLIIPWIVASVVYFLWNNYSYLSQPTKFLKLLVKPIVLPWYHLWYIPSLLIMVIIMSYAERMRINRLVMFLSAFCYAIIFSLIHNKHALFPAHLDVIATTYGFHYFVFFVLGVMVRQGELPLFATKNRMTIGLLIFSICRLLNFAYFNGSFYSLDYFVLNILSVIVILSFAMQTYCGNSIIPWIGQHSLSIYLWHIFPILITRDIPFHLPILYYILTLASMAIFLFSLIKISNYSFFLRKYILGLTVVRPA